MMEFWKENLVVRGGEFIKEIGKGKLEKLEEK